MTVKDGEHQKTMHRNSLVTGSCSLGRRCSLYTPLDLLRISLGTVDGMP